MPHPEFTSGDYEHLVRVQRNCLLDVFGRIEDDQVFDTAITGYVAKIRQLCGRDERGRKSYFPKKRSSQNHSVTDLIGG